MRVLSRTLIVLAAVCASIFVFGFVLFAITVTRDHIEAAGPADGIVVLTGGGARIQAGAELLKQGRGKRMLISGVNRRTTKEAVEKISGLDHKNFTCCVDLGYEALDTVGNADETRTWANANNFRKLLVVTSSYHMPRSLTELALAMPEAELVPYVVTPKSFPDSGWWLHVATTRILLSEYLKYIPAITRLKAQQILGWQQSSSVALDLQTQSGG